MISVSALMLSLKRRKNSMPSSASPSIDPVPTRIGTFDSTNGPTSSRAMLVCAILIVPFSRVRRAVETQPA